MKALLRLFKRKYDWKVMFLCVAATLFIWLLNAMNRNHVTDVSYPVVFLYDNQDLMQESDDKKMIEFHAYGLGWDLLKLKLNWFINPVEIKIKAKKRYSYLLASEIRPFLEDKIPVLEIRYFLSDTLYTGLDKVKKERLKIYVDRDQSFLEENYKIDGVVHISPEYIVATGPASIMDTISHKIIVKLSKKNISDSYKEEIKIPQPPSKQIKYTTNNVVVSFDVIKHKRPFTE